MKPSKTTKHVEAHTSKSKIGRGDFYGTGIRQPVGRMIEGWGEREVPQKKLGKPPKSLA
jgi:hypothetical protein